MALPGGATTDNGNGRLRDAQLEARIVRLEDRVIDLQGAIEALRLEFMSHRGAAEQQMKHIGDMVHDNTAALNKFCAVEQLKWENHADLHNREQTNLRTWSAVVSAFASTIAGVLGWFGGPAS